MLKTDYIMEFLLPTSGIFGLLFILIKYCYQLFADINYSRFCISCIKYFRSIYI